MVELERKMFRRTDKITFGRGQLLIEEINKLYSSPDITVTVIVPAAC
jgi:hypothetical protein